MKEVSAHSVEAAQAGTGMPTWLIVTAIAGVVAVVGVGAAVMLRRRPNVAIDADADPE